MLNFVSHSSAFPVDMCPKNASYYGNRAATLMMLGKFREALGDAQQSVRLDDSFVRVCNRAVSGVLSCLYLSSCSPGFLRFDIINILGQIILYCRRLSCAL